MSDEDDWFEKDIEDIVQEVQEKKKSNDEELAILKNQENAPLQFSLANDPDYGGNYEIPTHKIKEKKIPGVKNTPGFHVQTISYKKLQFIADLSPPLNVFLEISQTDSGYIQGFKKTSNDDFIIGMLGILARVCDTPLEQYKHEYLSTFVDSSEFLDGVRSLLKKIFMDTKNKSKKSIGYQISPLELSSKLMTIFKSIFSMNLWNDTIQNLFSVLSERLANSGSKFADLKIEVEKVSSLLERQAHRNLPEDIYPTLEELTTNTELDLKPNIVNGDYVNVENYVDIHANLLREDFLIPLRDLITELKSHENLDSISSNKIYKNVRILLNDSNNTKNKKGELVLVDFKAGERNESPNHIGVESTWVNPKKLMYGSLLVFSKDLKFESVILAVVSNREIESIQKGYIQIEIVKMYNIGKVFGEEFIMFESDVYFEPYHYTYKVLRSLNEDNFPLANYIVNIERNAHPPTYLESSKLQTYRYNKSCFYPLDHSTYSSINETLKLDSSQSKAYFHALSNKFSLIQGPPGTGKTFMGLKLASTILKNIQDCQVAVICYTNHALDQFLVGLLPLLEECNLSEDCIVRMGNQSKNELLDKYNVKQISDATTITDRRLKACFYQTKNDYMKTFQEFEKLQQEYDGSDGSKLKDIIKVQRTLRKISRKLDELKQISDFNTIKDKRVIAMTTTYASRQNILLQLLATPIVIIEEAAEVLESHIVASLNKNVQHLIMIGDHMQLRPTTSVYKLSQKLNMNISLFERMVNNQVNSVCLETQHRMRPEIADLIRPSIYKSLIDHESVKTYPNIRGIAKNLFFVTHSIPESKFKDETTKRNVHEAQFLCGLANFLIMHNYHPEDIVLLTTYNGQMIQLLNEKKQYPLLQKVRVTVVDNFQGEESKIILLSLVRNNEENKIGFLSLKNRICVALSRAKEGLFVVGAMDFFGKNNSIWKEIIEKLSEKAFIGECLPLVCQRHNTSIEAKTSQDFKKLKFGGCFEPCDFEFPCGHVCSLVCHWDEFDHCSNCNCRKTGSGDFE